MGKSRGMSLSPLDALGRGLVAGAVGTGVMTGAQLALLKATGGEESTVPAQVGKRIIEGTLQRGPVPDSRIPLLNNAMHWLYGISWGGVYGLVAGSLAPRAPRAGLAFGLAVWGTSLVQLPAMKLAPPVWEYPPSSLATDVGFHAVYGVAVAGAYRVLD